MLYINLKQMHAFLLEGLSFQEQRHFLVLQVLLNIPQICIIIFSQ